MGGFVNEKSIVLVLTDQHSTRKAVGTLRVCFVVLSDFDSRNEKSV